MQKNRLSLLVLLFLFMHTQETIPIEIPMEGTSGTSVGFVDMERVFMEHPKYEAIKTDYDKLLKDREKEVQDKETEINSLKTEITTTTLEMDRIKQEIGKLMLGNIDGRGKPVDISTYNLTGSSVQFQDNIPDISTTSPGTTNIPDSPRNIPVPEVSVSTPFPPVTPAPSPQVQLEISTESFRVEQSTAEIIQSSPAVKTMEISTAPAVSSQVKALQAKISEYQALLKIKDEKFKQEQQNLETRKREIGEETSTYEKDKTLSVMADFYKIIEDIAKEENISVVVEKSSILYGLAKIDLTEKVRERLRGR